MRIVVFIFLSFLLLVLLLINSFFDNKKNYYRIALIIASVSLVLHFYIYTSLGNRTIISMCVSMLKSISATLKTFGGYTLISDTDFLKVFDQKASYMMLLYYVLHIMAFSMTLSALVLTIGKKFIYRAYKTFVLAKKKTNYYIFYKYNDNSKVSINKLLSKDLNSKIIILDDDLYENIENYFNDLIWDKHCIILNEDFKDNVLNKLLTRKKFHDSNLKLLILGDNHDDNYNYAKNVYNNLKKQNYHNKISLTIITDDYYNFDFMQEDNGYDFIRCVSYKDIISRVLVSEYYPSKYIEFNNCKPINNNNFKCLIIGFGELGQIIFERLFIYGQFNYIKFDCDIIDENYNNVCAEFESKFDFVLDESISNKYNYIKDNIIINRYDYNARSKQFYEYMSKYANVFNYIVVATGSIKTNNEIVKNLINIRNKFKNTDYDIFDCTEDRIYIYSKNKDRKEINIFDYILDDSIDECGKLINYAHELKGSIDVANIELNKDRKDEINETWHKCSSYNKNSSISSAEFYKTILDVIGKKDNSDYTSIINYINNLPIEDKEILAKIEHDRWSSYLLTSGFRYMDYDNKKGTKDEDNKLHCCLIPFEKLDKLGDMIKKTTGEAPNYKENDFKNIVMAIKIAEMINNSNKTL